MISEGGKTGGALKLPLRRYRASQRVRSYVRALVFSAWLFFLTPTSGAGQSNGTPSAAASIPANQAPYLRRGDEVEQRYKTHRERLEYFFGVLSARLEAEAPELRQKLVPPAPVPFGYQVLPGLLTDLPARGQRSRIVLSPFSWPRTDSLIDRGREKLVLLERRFDSAAHLTADARLREDGLIVDDYKKLLDGQKFLASLIQYNRLWQSEIARLPGPYEKNNALRDAALARQALLDSISREGEEFRHRAGTREAVLSQQIDSALQKAPTPDFVRVEHPGEHVWILRVPIYTDISDSTFISRARDAIENGWHVQDVDDDFSVKLDIRRILPSQLYASAVMPSNGQHIDIAAHVKRFPQGGVVLTTGANLTYAFGPSIVLGPHAIPRGALVHEFGHMLGFKDGYFRSYKDRGENGYEVLEVILDPEGVVAAPANGKARRQHFEQILKEKLQ